MKTKALSLIAGTALAAAAVTGPAATANAGPTVQISFGKICIHLGPKASKNVVKFKAAVKGFTNVHNISYLPRKFGAHCGVYVSLGKKFGVKYRLVSSVVTGKLLVAKPLGFVPGGFKVPGFVIKQKAAAMGYTSLHALKYSGFTQRYTIEGWKKFFGVWKQYRLRFTKMGVYLGRTLISSGPAIIPGWKIKQKAALMGYKALHALKYNAFTKRWTIEGYKKFFGVWKQYRLRFSKTGVYLGRTLIGSGPAIVPGWKIKQKATAMGYKALHALKYHPFTKRWTVEGWKKFFGVWKQYRLRFSKTGIYLGRTAI